MTVEDQLLTSHQVYSTADASHDADFLTPLHHGIIRYVPTMSVPLPVRNSLPAKNDRSFIFVPVGYVHRNKDYIAKILNALDLKLPNICVVTAEATGSADAQHDTFEVQNVEEHPVAKDWTEEHTKEVLSAKVGSLLQSVMESSMGVGAWLIPDSPRRHNGAAQMICEALPKDGEEAENAVALGLIALDEEEESDQDLKKSLKAVMVPLGSPVKSVMTLSLDANVTDGAPCPQLTHLVIFESPEEKAKFRSALLGMVPDFMLAFGNITREAMRHVFDNARSGSPVVLLKHTGTNVDSLCRMFRHVRKHIKTTVKEGTSPITQPRSPSHQDNALLRIPSMEDETDELIRLFINTWPPGFNVASVVLADPLLVTGPTLQKRLLAAVTAAFDLKVGSTNTQLIKRKALTYAWSFQEAASHHSSVKKKSTEILHLQLICFTLLSIVAAVVYDQVYGGGNKPNNPMQLIAYVLTIILPLYITSLKQESDKGTALSRWGTFEVAARKIESEIFKFRTQVGIYRVHDKTQASLQEPVEHFTRKIGEIWLSVQPQLQQDGMAIPENFWEFDGDAHFQEEEASQKPPTSSPIANLSAGEVNLNFPDETTPMLHYPGDVDTSQQKPFAYDEEAPPKQLRVVVNDDEDDDIPFVDDKYSPMKVEDYMECRMETVMQQKAQSIQSMVKRNERLSLLIKLVTVFSGATAALSLQWCVPIVLGVSAALGTGQEFRKYPKRIEHGNGLVVKLNELKLWWMGLSLYERQLPHHKDRLVLESERGIIGDVESTFNSKPLSPEGDQ